MRRIKKIFQSTGVATATICLLAAGLPATARADTANEPSLVISQLKITSGNGQFITLYNSTDDMLDMSKYRLEYFNNYDLNKATSNKQISLSGGVPPHSYFVINDDSLTLCYQLAVDSVSLGLSSTAGTVEIIELHQSQPGALVTSELQDYVSWSKKYAPGAQILPSDKEAFLMRQPVDEFNNPIIGIPGEGDWQIVRPDPADRCGLITEKGVSVAPTGLTRLLPGSEPPATILTKNSAGATAPELPAADIGLKAPTVTELLPNPLGTGNDSKDEFIELYNSNGKAFDLSGLSLQVGTTTTHAYEFPAGTKLPPHSFKAFYSSSTKLHLSNSGGQAKLLDPFGNSISTTAIYSEAEDGIAWALAKGKWYWTIKTTPGAANAIKQPPDKHKKNSKGKSAKEHTAGSATDTGSTGQTDGQPFTSPIHASSLALVGAAALLYGAYEYRHDIKNRIYEFKSYFRTRREGRA